jgi:hypothetical protein
MYPHKGAFCQGVFRRRKRRRRRRRVPCSGNTPHTHQISFPMIPSYFIPQRKITSREHKRFRMLQWPF